MLTFVSIIVIVFGILQIILFFKVWAMTNDVRSIKGKMSNSEHSFKRYMLMGEKEKAYLVLKDTLVNRLLLVYEKSEGREQLFMKNVGFLQRYIDKAKLTGFDLPEYLRSAEAFCDYYKKVGTL